MATVTVRDSQQVLAEPAEISSFLARCGIWYRKFESIGSLPEEATGDEVLDAFREPIEELKARGGYVTADVIDVSSATPGLDAMLNRFNKEHWHDEDDVRFVVGDRGLFHVHPTDGPVFSIEVERLLFSSTGGRLNPAARRLPRHRDRPLSDRPPRPASPSREGLCKAGLK